MNLANKISQRKQNPLSFDIVGLLWTFQEEELEYYQNVIVLFGLKRVVGFIELFGIHWKKTISQNRIGINLQK
jgi:hypothetical protein